MSTDQAIRDADLYYTQLEANLQEKVNRIEADHTGYDRYRYNIDEIGHDPFILISYLSAKYEIFEFDSQVKADLDALFAAQYSLTAESSTETITEKKMVRVGESLGQVVTSGYCSCPICCGQWSGGPTASGVYPQGNHTIAVDAYNPILPFGTKVVMNGVEYTVEDTGNLAQYGVTFDVYYDSHSDALNHGHRTWEAYLSDANGKDLCSSGKAQRCRTAVSDRHDRPHHRRRDRFVCFAGRYYSGRAEGAHRVRRQTCHRRNDSPAAARQFPAGRIFAGKGLCGYDRGTPQHA